MALLVRFQGCFGVSLPPLSLANDPSGQWLRGEWAPCSRPRVPSVHRLSRSSGSEAGVKADGERPRRRCRPRASIELCVALRGQEALEHPQDLERSCPDLVLEDGAEQPSDAVTGADGASQRFHVVEDELCWCLQRPRPPILRKFPVLQPVAGHELVANASVREQVARMRRPSMSAEVGRRRKVAPLDRPGDAQRDHAGAEQIAEAEAGMKPLFHQIDEAFIDRELEADIRILRLELREHRRQQPGIGAGRHGQAERAGGRLADGAGALDGILDLLEGRPRSAEQRTARLRELQRPGRAHQQPHTEPALQQLQRSDLGEHYRPPQGRKAARAARSAARQQQVDRS